MLRGVRFSCWFIIWSRKTEAHCLQHLNLWSPFIWLFILCRLEWKPKKPQKPTKHMWRNMPQPSPNLNRRWQKLHRYGDDCVSLCCVCACGLKWHSARCLSLWYATLLLCNMAANVCLCVFPPFRALCHLQIVFFFLSLQRGVIVESSDWIHLSDWLDKLQIKIRSAEVGLHILPHRSSCATRDGPGYPYISLCLFFPRESGVAAPLPWHRRLQLISKSAHVDMGYKHRTHVALWHHWGSSMCVLFVLMCLWAGGCVCVWAYCGEWQKGSLTLCVSVSVE